MASKRKHQHHHQHQHIQHEQSVVEPTSKIPTTTNIKEQFPQCAIEALKLIGSNVKNRANKQELIKLAQECIFLNEFDAERNSWKSTAVTSSSTGAGQTSGGSKTAMQELQSIDCIRNYLKSESDQNIRELVFDVLFSDELSATSPSLLLLTSYAMSLECTATLECVANWVMHNIGNEIVSTIFNRLVYEHFLLESSLDNRDTIKSLGQRSPIFASLFMTIVLDMFSNDSIKYENNFDCLNKLFNAFEIWVRDDASVALKAFKSSANSYMLNPLPGLMILSIVHPLKLYISGQERDKVDELASRVHFMSLKIVQTLWTNEQKSTFNLIQLSTLESIFKKLSSFNKALATAGDYSAQFIQVYLQLFDKSMDKLGQLLTMFFQFRFISFSKDDVKNLYLKYFDQNYLTPATNIDQMNVYFQILLNAN